MLRAASDSESRRRNSRWLSKHCSQCRRDRETEELAPAPPGPETFADFNPYTGERLGAVPEATLEEVRGAFQVARDYQPTLTRAERAGILQRAAALVRERSADIAGLITAESGLCLKDSTYEVGRVADGRPTQP